MLDIFYFKHIIIIMKISTESNNLEEGTAKTLRLLRLVYIILLERSFVLTIKIPF